MSYLAPICAGQGYQLIFVDLTGSDSQLLAALASAKAKVVRYDPEEMIASYVASAPVQVSAPAESADPVLFTETRTSATGQDYTATVFRFGHIFADRGKFLIAISLVDASGMETWAQQAVVVAIGNGLPEGF